MPPIGDAPKTIGADDPDLNVFINCPHNDSYQTRFDAIEFTMRAFSLQARCAKEKDDASGVRIIKIMDLIEQCPRGGLRVRGRVNGPSCRNASATPASRTAPDRTSSRPPAPAP